MLKTTRAPKLQISTHTHTHTLLCVIVQSHDVPCDSMTRPNKSKRYAQAKTPNHDQQLPQLRGNLGQLCPVRNEQTKDRHRINIETQVVRLKGWKNTSVVFIILQDCVRSLVLCTLKNLKTIFYLFTTCLMCISPPIPGPRYGASAFCTVGSKALIFMMSCSASNKKDGKDTSIRRVQRILMHVYFSKRKLWFKMKVVIYSNLR